MKYSVWIIIFLFFDILIRGGNKWKCCIQTSEGQLLDRMDKNGGKFICKKEKECFMLDDERMNLKSRM